MARLVTETVVNAFLEGRECRVQNTQSTGDVLLLHGNVIARRNADGSIDMTCAGWSTVTTRERLNYLCERLVGERPFHQVKHELFFNEHELDARDWVTWTRPCRTADEMLAVGVMLHSA